MRGYFRLSTKSVDNFVGKLGKAPQNPLPGSFSSALPKSGSKYFLFKNNNLKNIVGLTDGD